VSFISSLSVCISGGSLRCPALSSCLLHCIFQENEEDVLRRIHSGGRLNPGVSSASRPATGMGPVSQISTQPLGLLGNAATMSNDFSLQLLHDLGIDAANITNQVFVANVRWCLHNLVCWSWFPSILKTPKIYVWSFQALKSPEIMHWWWKKSRISPAFYLMWSWKSMLPIKYFLWCNFA